MKRLPLGLRWEIVLNITVLMVSAIILIGVLILKIAERELLQQKAITGLTILNAFQHIIDRAQIAGEGLEGERLRVEIQGLVNAMTKGDILTRAFVVDRNGIVIADTRRELIGARYEERSIITALKENELNARIDRRGGILKLWGEGEMVMSAPLYGKGGIPIGAIGLKMPLYDLTKGLIQSQKVIMLYVFIDSIVLIIFGSYLISRSILRPIRRMLEATEAIARGDYEIRLSEEMENEIGRLARAFNYMTDRIREGRANLEKQLKSLEDANRQLKEAHDAMIRSERLASVGRLSAGIAHEIGNPISAILGYTEILLKRFHGKEEERECLMKIEEETQRINRIIRGLLDFSRPTRKREEDVDINRIIQESLSLLRVQKEMKGVDVAEEFEDSLPLIKADPDMIKQVIINLILNSLDAMDGKGILRIRTNRLCFNEDEFKKKAQWDIIFPSPLRFKEGSFVIEISIEDTGSGIRVEDIPNVFEPFFTTKAHGRGTGLGLSVSSGIVDSMGGHIAIKSKWGNGTSVSVFIPEGEGI